jgi:plasmid stabilization system protein ParE
MGKPLVTSAAEWDFTEALAWYAKRSLRAAAGFEAEFDKSLEVIGSDPLRFPKCDDRHQFYWMGRYPYQVIYREHGPVWLVIAVAHTKRRPGFWRDR